MKKVILMLLFVAFAQSLFAQNKVIPELNQKIVAYISSVIGSKVDRGECWDLANQALTVTGAHFDRSSQKTIYTFGKEVNPAKQAVFPGDIIQFTNVKVQYEKENTVFTETMAHHTAVVFRVYDKGRYQLAHQNTGFSGRKVGLSDINLADIKSGKFKIYRPFK